DQVCVLGNAGRIIFVVYGDAFFFELMGQGGGRLVIAADRLSMEVEIPGQGAHSDAADADEIYLFYVLYVEHIFYKSPSIDVAMRSAAFVIASRPIFSFSCSCLFL